MRFFWSLIAVLLGAAIFFGSQAEERRRLAHQSQAALETGDVVELDKAIDGDSVLVRNAAGETISIRILGIKSFERLPEKDPAARIGRAAVESIEQAARGELIRVMLHSPPADRHGRTLATLFVRDQDLGLSLVKQGLALVYTAHPFPSMPLYLGEQEKARAAKLGLWSERELVGRAELFAGQWRKDSD
jgi:micrococcal nuclease